MSDQVRRFDSLRHPSRTNKAFVDTSFSFLRRKAPSSKDSNGSKHRNGVSGSVDSFRGVVQVRVLMLPVEFIEDGVSGEVELYDEADEPSDRNSQTSAPAQPTFQEDWRSPHSEASEASETVVTTHTALGAVPYTSPQLPPRRSARLTRTARSAQLVPLAPPITRSRSAQKSRLPQDADDQQSIDLNLDFLPSLSYSENLPLPSITLDTPHSPSDRFIVYDDLLDTVSPTLALSNEGHATNPQIYVETSVFPLGDREEAMLLRHFVQDLAIWVGVGPSSCGLLPKQVQNG